MTDSIKGIKSNLTLAAITLTGMILFIPLFLFESLGKFDFWWWMSSNLVIMITIGIIIDKHYINSVKEDLYDRALNKIIKGLVSVIILYIVFYIGNIVARTMFDFAGEGIQGIYDFKGNAGAQRIVILMMFFIGPGEELFWRGILQRNFENKTGKLRGFLIATAIYTGVHVATGNIMLILAALFAGLFWGWMYMKYRSLLMNVVSHTVWDILIFVILPLNN